MSRTIPTPFSSHLPPLATPSPGEIMIRGDHDEDIYVGGLYVKKIFCIGPSTKDEICEVQVVVASSECMPYRFVDSAGCVCIV